MTPCTRGGGSEAAGMAGLERRETDEEREEGHATVSEGVKSESAADCRLGAKRRMRSERVMASPCG